MSQPSGPGPSNPPPPPGPGRDELTAAAPHHRAAEAAQGTERSTGLEPVVAHGAAAGPGRIPCGRVPVTPLTAVAPMGAATDARGKTVTASTVAEAAAAGVPALGGAGTPVNPLIPLSVRPPTSPGFTDRQGSKHAADVQLDAHGFDGPVRRQATAAPPAGADVTGQRSRADQLPLGGPSTGSGCRAGALADLDVLTARLRDGADEWVRRLRWVEANWWTAGGGA
jgi:hypothetical protein